MVVLLSSNVTAMNLRACAVLKEAAAGHSVHWRPLD